MAILQVKNLTTFLTIKGKKVKVVDNLSYDLEPKKMVAIVGESGCGKSMSALSLLKIVPGGLTPSIEGEVLYKGENLLSLPEKKLRAIRGNRIAMIFQNPNASLNPVYTVGEQMREVLFYHQGMKEPESFEHILDAMKKVGITNPEERYFAYPHQLSGGMLQRVMIAMALLLKPDILIADEPTTALDVTIQRQILELILKLQDEENMATLLITHDLGVVAEVADEVLVMYATENIEHGKTEELFRKPSHPYTRGLLESIPKKSGGKMQPIPGQVPQIDNLPKGCKFHPRCPYAMEICKSGEVPKFHTSETHWNRCWLFKEGTWPY